MATTNFVNIRRLCFDYLGPGWKFLFEYEKDAVIEFIKDSTDEQLRSSVHEINELLKQNELQLHDLLLFRFGLDYWPPTSSNHFQVG